MAIIHKNKKTKNNCKNKKIQTLDHNDMLRPSRLMGTARADLA